MDAMHSGLELVLTGPPGAGKGTQARRVADHYALPQIATGDILREAIQAGTPLGRQARETMARGELVSDEVMIGIVADRLVLDDCERGFVLDGFPRTLNQARALDVLLTERQRRLRLVVALRVSPDVVVVRNGLRRSCPSCGATFHLTSRPPARQGECDQCAGQLVQREDDREDVIRRRLEVYESQTAPLLAYYQEQGLLKTVDGELPMDVVTSQMIALVDAARLEGSGGPPGE